MSDIKRVIDELDIVDIVSETVELTKSGSNYKGLCPFHSESSPSFIVSSKKRIFKCFGCGEAGDALSFYMKTKKMEFIDAIKELASKYKIDLKLEKKSSPARDKNFDILKVASNFFRDNLFSKEGEKSLKYFTKDRGFEEELIYKYSLGYSLNKRDSLLKHLVSKGFSQKDILSLGLIQEKDGNYYDTFRDRAMFSITNANGDFIGFGGRVLDNKLPKYINSKDSFIFKKGYNLYGMDKSFLREKGYAILVEGYTDVLACHSKGFKNAVASLGTAFTPQQADLLKKYVSNTIIMYDGDSAGKIATKRAISILKSKGFKVKISSLYPFKDPDEFLKKESIDKMKERIKESKESFTFLYNILSKSVDTTSVLGKQQMISQFQEFFSILPNDLEKDIYMSKFSTMLNLSKEVLNRYIKSNIKVTNKKKKVLSSLESQTLMLLIKDSSFLSKVKKNNVINRSKISSLIHHDGVKIDRAIENFLSESEEDLKQITKGAKLIKDSKEFYSNLIEAWDRESEDVELNNIEDMLEGSEDKMKVIKAYYNKKINKQKGLIK